jgi:phosphatidate cytidylyltransferase
VNNFLTRTITGSLFVIIVIGSAILNFWLFAAVFGMFVIFGTWEFYNLVSKKNILPQKLLGTIIAFLLYFATVLNITVVSAKHNELHYLLIFLACGLIFLVELYKKSETPFQNIAFTFLGIIYIAIPFSLLAILSNYAKGNCGVFTFPVLYFLMIWANDTFAYLVGMAIGKHHLFERISPKKTWEGAAGGFVFTLILAFVFSVFFNFLTLPEWLGLAAIIVVFGTYGDLAESMLKRSVSCKDSGKFFPGHGGILDRFDSLLLSAPFVFVYLRILEIV